MPLCLLDRGVHLIRRNKDPELFEGLLSLRVVSKLLNVLSEEDWMKVGILKRNFLVEASRQLIRIIAKVPLHINVLIICELCSLRLNLGGRRCTFSLSLLLILLNLLPLELIFDKEAVDRGHIGCGFGRALRQVLL